MPKGPELIIAGKVYSCHAAAKRKALHILYDGPVDSIVTGADSEFVEELWLNRPDKLAEFAGKRVVRFERRMQAGPFKRTQCFWAVFEDGSGIDFSLNTALDNIVENHRSQSAA